MCNNEISRSAKMSYESSGFLVLERCCREYVNSIMQQTLHDNIFNKKLFPALRREFD